MCSVPEHRTREAEQTRLTFCVTDFLNLQHLFVCFSGGSDGSGVLSSPVQVWTNLLLSAKGHRLTAYPEKSRSWTHFLH